MSNIPEIPSNVCSFVDEWRQAISDGKNTQFIIPMNSVIFVALVNHISHNLPKLDGSTCACVCYRDTLCLYTQCSKTSLHHHARNLIDSRNSVPVTETEIMWSYTISSDLRMLMLLSVNFLKDTTLPNIQVTNHCQL
jgi:hypothetical protein